MSFSLKEIIGAADYNSLDKEVRDNLLTLLERIGKIRQAYGKPMKVTSGLRTKEDQIRIYAKKGITDISKIPMGSQHLKGAAVDIFDPNRQLQEWCKQNVSILEQNQLWCEDFSATPNWVHFQIFPPKSGNRFFKP
jgi:hypothetical protein